MVDDTGVGKEGDGRSDVPANYLLQFFTYEHLPFELRQASAHICEVAKAMDIMLPGSPEKTAGLRKLLEAKDCFVRALVAER